MFALGTHNRRHLIAGLCAISILVVPTTSIAKPFTVVINKPRSASTYMFDLMKLALSYTDGAYKYDTSAETLSKSAQTEAVKSGELAVMWAGTSEEMEQEYIPVRIDGYRGLMSLRFFIIRGGDQALFDSIKTKNDLTTIKYGQGRKWKDAEILEHSGLTVEKATKKNSLYYMLEGGRFDAFPRGATEAWKEAEKFSHLNLRVEKGLIITYPLPTYFFVHKGYPQLALDIENGLEKALADGSFNQFFYQNERVIAFLDSADLDSRRVIALTNPFLPKKTPLDRTELWPTIEDLVEGAKQHALAQSMADY